MAVLGSTSKPSMAILGDCYRSDSRHLSCVQATGSDRPETDTVAAAVNVLILKFMRRKPVPSVVLQEQKRSLESAVRWYLNRYRNV
jgi:hypothetical protein